MGRVIDFNEFKREREKEEIAFRIGGKEYPMAPTLPAIIAVEVVAIQGQEGDDADVPMSLLTDLGETVFGRVAWKQILTENQLSMDELADLIQAVLSAYAPEKPEDPQTAST